MIPWGSFRRLCMRFWGELRLVFVPGFAISCLIIWLVDYTNVFYYLLAVLVCFCVAFLLMFRSPEQRIEFKGDV